MEHKNYGLAGGTLDPTKYIEASLEMLCTPDEIGNYCDRTQAMPLRRIDNGSINDGEGGIDGA